MLPQGAPSRLAPWVVGVSVLYFVGVSGLDVSIGWDAPCHKMTGGTAPTGGHSAIGGYTAAGGTGVGGRPPTGGFASVGGSLARGGTPAAVGGTR